MVLVPRVALEGDERVMITVSLPSYVISSTGVSVIFFEVSPMFSVIVPQEMVKSIPPSVAVPPVTVQSTVTVLPDTAERARGMVAAVPFSRLSDVVPEN